MNLVRHIAIRFALGIGVLWGAATLTFVMINATSGDAAVTILGGPDALPTPEAVARVRAEYGLDQPFAVRYTRYLARLAHGDLGESYRLHIPVVRAIGQQIGPTIQLATLAAIVSIAAALTFALLTAGRARWIASAASGTELVVTSAPSFVIGILLLIAFSFRFHWFPAAGGNGWRSLVLPTITLALPISAVLAQVLRAELDDVLEQSFIAMARARGLSEARVRLGHALRHTLTPLITLSSFVIAGLLGGAVITESLFSRQGIGRLMLDATTNKDIPIVLGVTLISASVYVVINFVVDLAHAAIDPRLADVPR
ncbi:MAG TPA: ABC transporter permease [Pararobbsia sp.]|nr:ABC transporter permease [Pararobbsia sp.]